jgi:hypothetical protein
MMSEREVVEAFEGIHMSNDDRVRFCYAVCQAEGGYQAMRQDPANYHPTDGRSLIGTKFGVSFRYFYLNMVPRFPDLKEVLDDTDTMKEVWTHLPLAVCSSYAYWMYGRSPGVRNVASLYVNYYRPALLNKPELWSTLDIFKRRSEKSQVEKAEENYQIYASQPVPLLSLTSVVGHVKMLALYRPELARVKTVDRGGNGVFSALDTTYGTSLYDMIMMS